MPAEKNESVILSISPYRETSSILRLFTRGHGLIHGVAKGIRSGGKSSAPLDRGFLIESLVYYRPNRELHTLGSPHIINFFPATRSSVVKSSIRDIALELYLKTITQSEPHPELFALLADFLICVDESPQHGAEAHFTALWRFIRDYCLLTGFGIDTRNCRACGVDVSVIRYIDGGGGAPHPAGTDAERRRVTESLLQYCRRHFDIRGPFNSFEFLKSLSKPVRGFPIE